MKALNLRMLVQQLGYRSMKPTTIFCDNKGAIMMGQHPSNKPATRHIDMRKHFCGQHVELGNITTPYKTTTDMLADFVSKQTPSHAGILTSPNYLPKLVRQHDRWEALLTAEIGKAESLIEKENLKQSRRDDRRDIGRKNENFKHGLVSKG